MWSKIVMMPNANSPKLFLHCLLDLCNPRKETKQYPIHFLGKKFQQRNFVLFNTIFLLFWLCAKNTEADSPWLLFEFMEHGDLASVLRNSSFRPSGLTSLPVSAARPLFGGGNNSIISSAVSDTLTKVINDGEETSIKECPQFQLTQVRFFHNFLSIWHLF